MDWILQCLLFVMLTSTTAYNYREYSHPQYSFYDPTIRRIEHDPSQAFTNARTHDHTVEKPAGKPAQRMNERSISVTSGVQRVQEKERRRVQSWGDESVPRSENGSYKIVNNQMKYPIISTRTGGAEEMKASDSVVFPGRTSAQKFVPEIPADCMELGICESIPNYPHDLVNSIIAKLGDKKNRFHIDEMDGVEIAQRIGPDDNAEIELCNFRETLIKPQAAKGKDGNWFVILNTKDNPLQGYRVEVCEKKGQSCNENVAYFYGGYTAVCKQKFVQRTMAALDVDKKEVLYDLPFRVPSCCSCVAMHTGK